MALSEARLHAMPKVELHCHLDGSVPLGTAGLAAAQAVAPPHCENLAAYLACFGPVLGLLSNLDHLALATQSLVAELAAENVIYAELRFAPLSLVGGTQQGTDDPALVVRTVLKAMVDAGRAHGVVCRAILCMMRHHSEADNLRVLRLAERYQGEGVAGVDLAGDEAAYPLPRFAGLFTAAREMGLPYTIHAGESGPDGADNIRCALALGAKRIGHGIAAAQAPALVHQLAEAGALLELCPVSNLQTCAVPGWAQYPFARFLKAGIRLSVNTDNRTVSATSLTREWATLAEHYGPLVDEALVRQLTLNALDAAFLPKAEKAPLRQRLADA